MAGSTGRWCEGRIGRRRGRRQKLGRGRKARPFPIRSWVLFYRGHASVAVAVMFSIWKVLCRCEALLFGRRLPPFPPPPSPPPLRGGCGNLPRTMGFTPGVDHVLFVESSGIARLASPVETVILAVVTWHLGEWCVCHSSCLHTTHWVKWFSGQQRDICFSNHGWAWGVGVPWALLASRCSGPVLNSFTRPLLAPPSRHRYLWPVIMLAFLDCFSSLLEPTHCAYKLFVEIEAFGDCVQS